MSLDRSRSSTPLIDATGSPSSSSHSHVYSNGCNSSPNENVRLGSPLRQTNLPGNVHMHRLQPISPTGDHQFIKRPLNAYMIWTVQERKKILARDPSLKMNDVSRMMGEKWKALSDKDKRPFFEKSKQSKLDHKKALKDNPNLVYHPQRKKSSRAMKSDQSFESTPNTPLSNGRLTPITNSSQFNKLSTNGSSNETNSSGVAKSNSGSPFSGHTGGGTRTSQITTNFQRNHGHQSENGHHPSISHQSISSNMHKMLELYYKSLCQPAFPEPGEKSSMGTPQYYLDQYQQLHYQAVSNQYHNNQAANHAP